MRARPPPPGERLVERGGLAHACGREQALACGVGTPEPSDSTPGSAAEHLNRRVRNRTHGGVGGREGQPSLRPDHRVRARGPARGRGAGAGHRPSVRCGSRPGHTAGPARDHGTRGDGVGRRGRTHARAGPRLGCRGRLRYQIETRQGAPPPHPCSNRNARMPLLGVIAAYAFTEDACARTVQKRDRGVDGRSCITLLPDSSSATSHRAAGGTGRDHGVAGPSTAAGSGDGRAPGDSVRGGHARRTRGRREPSPIRTRRSRQDSWMVRPKRAV